MLPLVFDIGLHAQGSRNWQPQS